MKTIYKKYKKGKYKGKYGQRYHINRKMNFGHFTPKLSAKEKRLPKIKDDDEFIDDDGNAWPNYAAFEEAKHNHYYYGYGSSPFKKRHFGRTLDECETAEQIEAWKIADQDDIPNYGSRGSRPLNPVEREQAILDLESSSDPSDRQVAEILKSFRSNLGRENLGRFFESFRSSPDDIQNKFFITTKAVTKGERKLPSGTTPRRKKSSDSRGLFKDLGVDVTW